MCGRCGAYLYGEITIRKKHHDRRIPSFPRHSGPARHPRPGTARLAVGILLVTEHPCAGTPRYTGTGRNIRLDRAPNPHRSTGLAWPARMAGSTRRHRSTAGGTTGTGSPASGPVAGPGMGAGPPAGTAVRGRCPAGVGTASGTGTARYAGLCSGRCPVTPCRLSPDGSRTTRFCSVGWRAASCRRTRRLADRCTACTHAGKSCTRHCTASHRRPACWHIPCGCTATQRSGSSNTRRPAPIR